ncbi:MAG: hypothetical protein QW622_03450 [Candidatus Pacearchaeota archaeon]
MIKAVVRINTPEIVEEVEKEIIKENPEHIEKKVFRNIIFMSVVGEAEKIENIGKRLERFPKKDVMMIIK